MIAPKVSIVIPVYNGSNYMREAIDSALAQTYKNIEIIVINDGSDDNGKTEEIALSYGDKIRYLKKENGGVSSALNLGIKEMRGEYFSWLSHDDVYEVNKVEKEVEALSKLEDKNTLILCSHSFINKESKPIRKNIHHHELPVNELIAWDKALLHLIRHGSFNGCAFLISKNIFDECGYFDENLRFNQDGFMWNKIFLQKYSIYCISDVLVKGRIHSGQVTQTRQDLFHEDCMTMSKYLIPKFADISTKKQNFLYEYIIYNAKYGNKKVVNEAKAVAKKYGLLSFFKSIRIFMTSIWGGIRPLVRKIFYSIKYKIKSN